MSQHLPFPICAVCQKSVETMTTWHTMTSDAVVVVVECHGDREQATLHQLDLVEGALIGPGVAFATKQVASR